MTSTNYYDAIPVFAPVDLPTATASTGTTTSAGTTGTGTTTTP